MLMLMAVAAMGADADNDGFDASVDCDDDNAESHQVEDWYPDCDGDGVFNSASVASCGEPVPFDTICAGAQVPVGGYASVDRPPINGVIPGIDCDDTDLLVALAGDWYHDCDDDGFHIGGLPSCGQPVFTPLECQVLGSEPQWTLSPSAVADCDDADASENPTVTWYADADRDGFGDPASSSTCQRVDAINDVANADDCDDSDDGEHPGVTWYPDRDGDGYGDVDSPVPCERGSETCSVNGGATCDYYVDPTELDCYDRDPDDVDYLHPGDPALEAALIYPGAAEVVADNIDGNCDDQELCFLDNDNDNYRPEDDPNGTTLTNAGDHDCVGRDECDNSCPVTDCDDDVKAINPGENETFYNGQDDDCDPLTHDLDKDGDGFLCDPLYNHDCEDVDTVVPNDARKDCNDSKPDVNEEVDELCEVGTQEDDDCDGSANTQGGEYLTSFTPNATDWYLDLDGDGSGAGQRVWLCDVSLDPQPWSASDTDCDDSDNEVYVGAPERCNFRDDDCDSDVDEPTPVHHPFGSEVWHEDSDEDGFGSAVTLFVCPGWTETGGCPGGAVSAAGSCWVQDDTDCDDSLGYVYPGAAEHLDGRDSNCDDQILAAELDCDDDGYLALTPSAASSGLVDAGDLGLASCEGADPPSLECFFAPLALTCIDDFWTVSVAELQSHGVTLPRTSVTGDCDDLCDRRHPEAEEICDGVDNDCDDAEDFVDVDVDGLPDAMDANLDRPGYVSSLELDEDGDGAVVCDEDSLLGRMDAVVSGTCGLPNGQADCDDADPDVQECTGTGQDRPPKGEDGGGCGSGKSVLGLLPLLLLMRSRERA